MLFRPPAASKYDYNPDPGMSAGQRAEYRTATAVRRASTIHEAKFPKTTIIAKYREARSATMKHSSHPPLHHARASDRTRRRASPPCRGATIDPGHSMTGTLLRAITE
jgi:hypothetical protein